MYSKLFAGFFALSTLATFGDDFATKGRGILEKNAPAVLTVQVFLKMTYGGSSSPNESKEDLTATVVDGYGVTVMAMTACDPSELYQRVMSEEYSKARVQFGVIDIKMVLEDGTEIPCEIVLRDKDLDLAFIRPKSKPATPLPFVDLTKS